MTIMGDPTETSPDPAGTKILAKTPSSWASKSTVALSVSTLQKISPGPKLSPSSKFQLAMDPDSMVYKCVQVVFFTLLLFQGEKK